jgi:hypothetical protein
LQSLVNHDHRDHYPLHHGHRRHDQFQVAFYFKNVDRDVLYNDEMSQAFAAESKGGWVILAVVVVANRPGRERRRSCFKVKDCELKVNDYVFQNRIRYRNHVGFTEYT